MSLRARKQSSKSRDPYGGPQVCRLHWSASMGGAHRPLDTEEYVILSTAKVEDFDRFVGTFSTKGAEKRKQYGCKGSSVFRDPNENDRVWVVFDWDAAGWQNFFSDPEVPAIFMAAGLKGKPQMAEFSGSYHA
jgi:hypothetical protein